jgi:hypothetical protein
MDIIEIPFNKLLGMKKAESVSGRVLQLESSATFTNHVGTVHASVQMALAEASSAEFLLEQFPGFAARYFGVVRRFDAKFKAPLDGRIWSKATISDEHSQRLLRMLAARGRGIVDVQVEVVDDENTVGMFASIEWFIQKLPSA